MCWDLTQKELEEVEKREKVDKQQRLNSYLLDAIVNKNSNELRRLLEEGASPNATCRNRLVSAVHIAALMNWEALRVLLLCGADRFRKDESGMTPLHYAVISEGPRRVAMLLDFSEDLQFKAVLTQSLKIEMEFRALKPLSNPALLELLHTPIAKIEQIIPEDWLDHEIHDCDNLQESIIRRLPFPSDWTLTHFASSVSDYRCLRVLLAAGTDPNVMTNNGYTALDVAGSCVEAPGHMYETPTKGINFLKTVQILLQYGGKLRTEFERRFGDYILSWDHSVLHEAILMRSLEAIPLLMDAGAPLTQTYGRHETNPIKLCKENNLYEYLKILVKYRCRRLDEELRGEHINEEDKVPINRLHRKRPYSKIS